MPKKKRPILPAEAKSAILQPRTICVLCGSSSKKITFEHAPPRCAFNKSKIKYETMTAYVYPSGQPVTSNLPKGMGAEVLCEDCQKVSARYVEDYKKVAFAADDFLRSEKLEQKRKLLSPNLFQVQKNPFVVQNLNPLFFLKSVCMSALTLSPNFVHKQCPQLIDFILDEKKSDLPVDIGVWPRLYLEQNKNRLVAECVANIISVHPHSPDKLLIHGKEFWMCLFAHYPLDFLITVGPEVPNNYSQNIADFATKGSDLQSINFELPIVYKATGHKPDDYIGTTPYGRGEFLMAGDGNAVMVNGQRIL